MTEPRTRQLCGGCDASWTGKNMCHCSACHRTFTGITPFDAHRQGGTANRTCVVSGLAQNERGSWGRPGNSERFWEDGEDGNEH